MTPLSINAEVAGLPFSKKVNMRFPRFALSVVLLSLCTVAVAQEHDVQKQQPAPKSDAQMSFDTLKTLAGTWTGQVTTDPRNPEIDGPIQVTMSVASRENALMHEIAPGGVPEPTLIYLEGDRLTLVHYCEAGNRPRLVARKSPDQKTVEFDFVDISGSTTPAYLHHFVFTISTRTTTPKTGHSCCLATSFCTRTSTYSGESDGVSPANQAWRWGTLPRHAVIRISLG